MNATSGIFKQLHKVNSYPTGENSPNMVTLSWILPLEFGRKITFFIRPVSLAFVAGFESRQDSMLFGLNTVSLYL
jgi:hypothetical protein